MKTKSTLTKRVFWCFSLFLLAGFTILQGVAGAVVMPPQFDTLPSLADWVNDPTDVALDQHGNIYIAETNNNRVTVLDQSGKFSGKMIAGIQKPISVAVDGGGQILVGSGANGSVAVFNSNLRFLFKLGNGDNEFGKPMDIAVDPAGRIYVVDMINNAINIYNANGMKTGSIGTPGNGSGQLHHPTSMAIDNTAGEIVVLDHQQILDLTTNKMVDGARIQYFDMNGASLRSFSKYGYNNAGMKMDPVTYQMHTEYDISLGQLTKANQVTVDSQSRIYVTDARLQKVMVYDNNDNWLGAIDNANSPLRIPMGITMGASDRLYVASLYGKQIEVFGVDNYTAMVTTPSIVEFNVVENGSPVSSDVATISNIGNALINWTASTPDSWITIGSASGTLQASGNASLNISADPAGLTPGKHTGSVVIDSGAAATEVITVVLNVGTNPLQVVPSALSYKTENGTSASIQQLAANSSEGVLSWNVSADQPWIVLDKSSGVTPATVKVYADASSLDAGEYNGTITFVQQSGKPEVTVAVKLVVASSGADATPVIGQLGRVKWGKKWTITQVSPQAGTGTGADLLGVSGTSQNDALAVGTNGSIFHFDGMAWTAMVSGTTGTLNSVWSDAENSAYAVGADGLVISYDGAAWQEASSGGNDLLDTWASVTKTVTVEQFGLIPETGEDLGVALRTVWGSADDDVYAAGQAGAIFNFDGTVWTANNSYTTEWLNGIWGSSATDVFAVGENGAIIHFDGSGWVVMNSGTTVNLNGVCGTAKDDVYVVGDNSLILHYDGIEWVAVDADVKAGLNDIWCSADGTIVTVGDKGTIITGKGKMHNPGPQKDDPLTIKDKPLR